MEQKDRYLVMIFLVVLIISFVIGILRNWMIFYFLEWHDYLVYYQISVISSLITPLLVFIPYYLIGKKFDLRSNLKWSIISLLTGAYLGYFLSANIEIPLIGFVPYWERVIESIISLQFLYTFSIAFSALAIAYFKNNY